MGSILLPGQWQRQPPCAVVPATRSRGGGVLLNAGSMIDVLGNRPATRYTAATSALKLQPHRYGLAIVNDKSNQSYSVQGEVVGSAECTIVALVEGGTQPSAATGEYPYICGLSSTKYLGICTLNRNVSNRWGVYQDTDTNLDSGETFPTEGLQFLVYTRRADGYRALYRNGKLKASTTAALQSLPSARFTVGASADGGSNFYGTTIPIYYAGVFIGEAWSPEKISALANNPWAIFSRSPTLIVVPSSAGGAVSLTPTSGQITVVGNTPSITLPVALTPASGAIVLSGNTPSITLPAALTPDAGAVSLSGNTPSITLPVTLTPTTGAIVITGNTPTIGAAGDVTLTPSSGAISIAGNAPSISLPVSLTPSAGAISFVGNAPSLQCPVSLTPLSGLIGLSGGIPGITLPVSLTSISGQLILIGNSPTVSTGASTPIGIEELTGGAFATVQADYLMDSFAMVPADDGAFSRV